MATATLTATVVSVAVILLMRLPTKSKTSCTLIVAVFSTPALFLPLAVLHGMRQSGSAAWHEGEM